MACGAGNLILLIDTHIKYASHSNHQYQVDCSDRLEHRDKKHRPFNPGIEIQTAENHGFKRIISQLLEPITSYKWDSFELLASSTVPTMCQHFRAKIIWSTLLMLMERLNILTVSPESASRRKTRFSPSRFCYCWGFWRERENKHQQNHANS